MSIVKKVNQYLSLADAQDILKLKQMIIMTERQAKIFDFYYLKKINVDFIADKLCVSPETVHKELKKIREKITYFLQKVYKT